MLTKQDVEHVRGLAIEVASIASLPVQAEKRALWRRLNALRPSRPMVMIDQVCWNEMRGDEALELRCSDPECRGYEGFLRRTLYQWKHFPVDMVVEPFVRVPKAIVNTGFGVGVQEDTAATDPTSDVLSHRYVNQFQTEDDLQKIQMPRIGHNEAETERRLSVAHELFGGVLDVIPWGADIAVSLWDPISTWMGVQNALFALAEQPEFMHRLVGRLTDGYTAMLDQLEDQGLLCQPQSLVHCTGAFTDELPAPGYRPDRPRACDIWTFGLAQMFSTVSPQMFKEYEVDYASRLCGRFGLVYYGCCDPLDLKMNEVRMIPHVRKVSMSPWVNQERGAAAIHGDFVFSRKPSPALLAWDSFDPEVIREDLATTRDICEKHGCPLELILKDISTVRYEPERLDQWARVAMDVAGA
jgi:hypothetical protein